MSPLPVKHFYMIRHGQTEANAAKIMAGALDSPLTEKGRQQARAVQSVIEGLARKPCAVVHSNLSRARDTALIINEKLCAPIEEDSDLAEFNAGELEGVPYSQCAPLLTGWVDAPGGEKAEAFLKRVQTAKTKAFEKNDPVMIVSHGGVFRAFFKLYGIHMDGVQNCKLYEFMPKQKRAPKSFPWDIWRYDISDTISRTPVDVTLHPASEIAK